MGSSAAVEPFIGERHLRSPEAQRVLFALGWPVLPDAKNQLQNSSLKKIQKQAKYNF